MRAFDPDTHVPSNIRRAADFVEYHHALDRSAGKLAPEKQQLATDQLRVLWSRVAALFDGGAAPPEEAVLREVDRRRSERLRLMKRRRAEAELMMALREERSFA